MRPRAIESVLPELERLGSTGVLPGESACAAWFVRVGAVRPGLSGPWCVADPDWAEAAMPARDSQDLLRRTALRDPLYRCHVDLMVCRVLQGVAASGRWARLEELLQGAFVNFVPRFVQLLEWCAVGASCRAHELTEQAWNDATHRVEGEEGATLANWDRHLWGDVAGGPAALFPALEEGYGPLAGASVNVNALTEEMNPAEEQLFAVLVQRSRHGEGIPLRQETVAVAQRLRTRGLPVRLWAGGPDTPQRLNWIGVVSAVRMVSTQPPAGTESEGALLRGVDRDLLRSSRVEVLEEVQAFLPPDGLWSVAERGGTILPCIGREPGRRAWPSKEEVLPAPSGYRVPDVESLRAIGQLRSLSPAADEALLLLGQHYLYGVLIQGLLVEALDHELGSETLTLASPDSHDEGGVTRVLYAPRPEGEEREQTAGYPVYELGSLDDVFAQIAQDLGLRGALVVYSHTGEGAWAAGLRLLRAAGLVARRPP
jgi:hypothetical protein